MKNITKFFALAVVILGFSATSFGQLGVGASGILTAEATISSVAAVSGEVTLNFGNIGSGAGGTVIIPPVGARTGTAVLLAGSPDPVAGSFDVTAEVGNTVHIAMPSGLTTLSDGVSSTVTIAADSWKYKIGASDVNASRLIDAITTNVKVGATLTVGDGQTPGSYTGTYIVTVVLE